MIGALRAVPVGELPLYRWGRDDRLQGHFFTMFQHGRWLNSALHLTAPLDVQGAALNLFLIAQMQSPIGTLPRDDVLLARLLRITDAEWLRVRDCKPMGALHNWEPCQCEGEVRLMHPVVTEQLADAFAKREARELANNDKAVAARQDRLRRALEGLGVSKTLVGDEVLVGRLDEWLVQTCRGKRLAKNYEDAVTHAARMGWM
jgi:hypothetical protein